ncbi:MAG: putative DNA binding domain-containing protein [Gudongella sp.]|nr:putative DNA binding domain-containing protein [Gudongella sp.]
MKESNILEYKEKISDSFIKTVSAYANYNTGKIVFGIKDNGDLVGVDDIEQTCLNIENKINDSIKPKPDYSFHINESKRIVTLIVYEGLFKPYLYKGKAYKRSDTSTIEVDQVELKRLVLLGENLYFDELSKDMDSISFEYFFKILEMKLKITNPDMDTLKTLGLYNNKKGYNNAALLFADKNNFPGIDIVRFGSSINDILFRERIVGISILEQLERAELIFDQFYKKEQITEMERKEIYLVPKEAYREALANALVHRTWDVDSHIRVLMHSDKIEIFSPGGLPIGLSRDEYINGYISNLRNPIVANIFFRLNIIEMLGTGVRRIKEAYYNIRQKPIFEIKENSILIILPSIDMKEEMSSDEKEIFNLLSQGKILASSEIANKTGFSRDKVIRLMNSLVEKKYVKKEGRGRGTKYRA